MSCVLHKVHILSCNLTRLGNLKSLCTVSICHPERTTTRLALVAHHTADADWTREEFFEQCSIVILRKFHAQLTLHKLGNGSQIGITSLERSQLCKGLSLKLEEQTCKSLLIEYGIATQSIGGNIVNILYKDD